MSETGGSSGGAVTVRIFASLRLEREQRGLPVTFEVGVPKNGISGRDLAVGAGLTPAKIEGVFVNHVVRGLAWVIRPGDRVAFVPYDTPGPHRYYLGLYDAGKSGRGDAEV